MKKENFVTLILVTIGGILFAVGMCMCLLPEWNAFTQGVVVSAVGAAVLLAMLIVRRKMKGKLAAENSLKYQNILHTYLIRRSVVGAIPYPCLKKAA